jgi:beta-glucanase (GH16 family)
MGAGGANLGGAAGTAGVAAGGSSGSTGGSGGTGGATGTGGSSGAGAGGSSGGSAGSGGSTGVDAAAGSSGSPPKDGGATDGGGTDGSPTLAPSIFEHFNPWTGTTSPDKLWRIAGSWTGTGGNLLTPANAVLVSTYDTQPGGYLLLTVKANVLEGGEIQTVGTAGSALGYGYYEVRMKVTDVPGTCVSFFWKEVDYGPGEIDVEFLTNESWITSATTGKVHYTIHPGWDTYGTAFTQDLAFNPSKDFHRYGWLWTPEKLSYTVDGQVVKTFTNPPAQNLVNTKGGYIMMNAWTGSATWGGGPPTKDATSAYDWVKFYPNATAVPAP